jgi:hypothetical protein
LSATYAVTIVKGKKANVKTASHTSITPLDVTERMNKSGQENTNL